MLLVMLSVLMGDEGGVDVVGEEDAVATTRGARDGEARGEVVVVVDVLEVEEMVWEEEERVLEVEVEVVCEEEVVMIEALRRALEATLSASSKIGAGWLSEMMKEWLYCGGGVLMLLGLRLRRVCVMKVLIVDVDVYNKSDEEESTSAARSSVDRETAARRARCEL